MCSECNGLLAYTRVGRCCSGSISCVESRGALGVLLCSIPADSCRYRFVGALWCVCEVRWFDQKSYEWVWAGGHNALEECLVT